MTAARTASVATVHVITTARDSSRELIVVAMMSSLGCNLTGLLGQHRHPFVQVNMSTMYGLMMAALGLGQLLINARSGGVAARVRSRQPLVGMSTACVLTIRSVIPEHSSTRAASNSTW